MYITLTSVILLFPEITSFLLVDGLSSNKSALNHNGIKAFKCFQGIVWVFFPGFTKR